MKLAELPIPERFVAHCAEKGITELYPPQEECVRRGLFQGKNLLIAIPTASGKTLVAEMAMQFHCSRGGKCLYIVPLKALASEKHEDFSGKGLRIGISTGDYDRKDEHLGTNDVIVATCEKVDSLIRNRSPWLERITLLVVDEVHLLDSPDRGPTLEMVIAKFRYRMPELQLIALSATISNSHELGAWLDAEVITSEWRPVELRQGVYYRGEIQFRGSGRRVEALSRFDDVNLVLDTVREGGQCLVFVSSRKNAEALAKRVASALPPPGEPLPEAAARLAALAEIESERELAACVARGAAFHHAGLRGEARKIVESAFRRGGIRCIASTPTLAAGLNLPARRVIVRDHHRYQAGEGSVPIPVMEYHQMAGRAGRPHLDPYGEAVLIARSAEDVELLFEWFIESPPEAIGSRLANLWALCTHILSLISTGFVNDDEGLVRFLKGTFYHHQKGDAALLERILEESLRYLAETEMISDLRGRYAATEYGGLVSRLYLDPRSAEIISTGLRERERFSELGFLQMLCSTPDMPVLPLRRGDEGVCERAIQARGEELWMDAPMFGYDQMNSYLRSLKTALLLLDWADEVGEATICERYGAGPGDIHTMTESVLWLVHAGRALAQMFARMHAPPIGVLERRMRHGVKAELLPLVALRGIGRVRARRLYNNGLVSIESLRAAGVARVAPILGAGIARQVFSQLEEQERSPEEGAQVRLDEFGEGTGGR